MSLRVIVSCDSDPAEYAREAGERCRGWLPCSTNDPTGEALAQGWSYLMRLPPEPATALPVFVHRCPACTRAIIARAAQRPQEPAP